MVPHSSFAACPRRLWLRAREFAFVAYPGHPAFTPAGATATPLPPPRFDRPLQEARHARPVDKRINRRERRRPVLRHDDILSSDRLAAAGLTGTCLSPEARSTGGMPMSPRWLLGPFLVLLAAIIPASAQDWPS